MGEVVIGLSPSEASETGFFSQLLATLLLAIFIWSPLVSLSLRKWDQERLGVEVAGILDGMLLRMLDQLIKASYTLGVSAERIPRFGSVAIRQSYYGFLKLVEGRHQ
jgi:hypothetical protein